jgi:hypothetical protein
MAHITDSEASAASALLLLSLLPSLDAPAINSYYEDLLKFAKPPNSRLLVYLREHGYV